MGGSWADGKPWWRTFGRCGRCRRWHWLNWRTMKSSWFNGHWCPHCGSGKVF